MKKNGFTLVELLAVIAILAILVIIALPNIMSMFNQARKNSFTTEIREIYKVAQQQWISDSLFTTSEKVYSRCSSCSGKSLDMSGRSQLEYYIKIDKSGKVVEYYATDGSYQYSYNNTGGLNIEDIEDVKVVSDLPSNQVLNISSDGAELGEVRYIYTAEYGGFKIGDAAPELDSEFLIYDNYQGLVNAWGYPFFNRLKVSGDTITGLSLGYIANNQLYYLDWGMSYDEIHNIMYSSANNNCESSGENTFNCYAPSKDGSVDISLGYSWGSISVFDDPEGGYSHMGCMITERHGAYCAQP